MDTSNYIYITLFVVASIKFLLLKLNSNLKKNTDISERIIIIL